MKILNNYIIDIVIPNKLMYKHEIYKITWAPERFFIKGFFVRTINGKIDTLTIKNSHPNSNPRTGEFCIPHILRSSELNKQSKSTILSILACFNLDDCYFTPWDEIKYKKQEVF